MSLANLAFNIADESESAEIWDFLLQEFFPDEPVSRSLGILENITWLDRLLRRETFNESLTCCVKQKTSVVARNGDGHIVGSTKTNTK